MGDIGKVGDFLAGGASALDSLFGFSAKRQENAQKRLMDKQQDQWKEQQQILAEQQLAQWNRENEYNDPTNYYKRLFAGAEANGINPKALVGDSAPGSVGQSATGVTAPGSTSTPGVGGVQQQSIVSGMGAVMQSMRQRAEIALLEAQARNLDQQNKESDSRISLNRMNEGYISALTLFTSEQAVSEPIKRAGQILSNTLSQYDVDTYDARFITQQETAWASIQNAYASAYKSWQEGDKLGKEIQWYDTKAMQALSESRSQVAVNWAMAKAQEALASKYGAEEAKILLESQEFQQGMESRLSILSTEAQWAPLYQFTHTLGSVSDFKFGVLNFANNGGKPFSPDFDPRWQYYELVMQCADDAQDKRTSDGVSSRKKAIHDTNPIKK